MRQRALVGQVGQAGGVAVPEGPGQGEDDLGGPGGVGGHGVGPDGGLVGHEPVKGVQAVSLGPRDQGLVEGGVGVGHPGVERGAALAAEVAGVVTGVDGRDGDDEAHPVG